MTTSWPLNKHKIARTLNTQAARHIRKLGDALRAEPGAWPIPENYALHMSVAWPDPMVPGRVSISASINACTVRSVFAIDESAKLLRTSFVEIAKDLWSQYLLVEEPEFCARLRAKDRPEAADE